MRPRLAPRAYTHFRSQRSTALALACGVVYIALAACASPAVDNAANRETASPATAASASPSPDPAPELAKPISCDTEPAPDVCNATVNIPSWGEGDSECPHGAVRIIGGRYQGRLNIPGEGIMKVLPADVDHDGVAEEVVLASCQIGDPPIDQVFVVDHTASGVPHTMGQIIRPGGGVGIKVNDLAASRGGDVRIRISNVLGSDGTAFAAQVDQWRSYGWNGERFTQTGGSTSFEADRVANRLTMSVAPAVFAKPQGALRHGTVRVTVHNTGTAPASAVAVRLIIDHWLSLIPSPCDPQGLSNAAESCPTDIPPGGTRTITFSATITAADASTLIAQGGQDHELVVIQLRLGDQLYRTIQGTATFQ